MTSTYTLAAALLAALLGCSDEGDGEQRTVDAAPDVPRVCQAADCQSQARPPLTCPAGGTPQFSCSRGLTDRCEWTNARCATEVDAGEGDSQGELGPDALGDDAPDDAPLASDSGDDAG